MAKVTVLDEAPAVANCRLRAPKSLLRAVYSTEQRVRLAQAATRVHFEHANAIAPVQSSLLHQERSRFPDQASNYATIEKISSLALGETIKFLVTVAPLSGGLQPLRKLVMALATLSISA